MKVIFLDFDGVINDWYTFNSVNEKCLDILKLIVEETSSKIVITSSNKYSFQRRNNNLHDTLCYKLYIKSLINHGLQIYDFTPCILENRELEIMEYLKLHPEIKEFLILDDDYIFKELLNHEVFIDLYKGLDEEHIIPSLNILNGMLGFYPKDFDIDESYEKRLIRINNYYRKK